MSREYGVNSIVYISII